MEYTERKIKDVIREAFFIGVEKSKALIATGNPYATLEEDLHRVANEVESRGYDRVMRLVKK
jgi:predicted aconitase